ncbi:hypothetical protein APC29_15430, partial [Acinetobacter pittii]
FKDYLYKSLQEKNAFFSMWQIHCLYKYKIIAGERFIKNPPKEQQARKLSGKRTVIIKKSGEKLRFIRMENNNL